jgi:hypothetical protein
VAKPARDLVAVGAAAVLRVTLNRGRDALVVRLGHQADVAVAMRRRLGTSSPASASDSRRTGSCRVLP